MPRLARTVCARVPHHVTQRGNRREAVFFADDDYRAYLAWLKDYAEKHEVEILAYCLMTNHIHLIAVPASEGAVRSLVNQKRAVERRAERVRLEAEELIERLKGLVLEIRGRAGEGGRLFGSVTSQQVADALAKRGFAISRKQVELDEPIRIEGFYHVPIRVAPGRVVNVDLNVVGTK